MAILLVWLPGCGKKRIVNPDTTPPNQIADFTVDQVTETTLALHWTAPGDDGNTGQAAAYQIKYSKAQITQQNFSALSDSAIAPTPLPVGKRQTLLLRGLQTVTMYYAAIRARDESNNWSPIAVIGPIQTARDSIPPGTVSNLRVATLTNQSISLTWTAPGDDGTSGRASRYEIRLSSQHIDSTTFDSAAEISQAIVPAIANAPQVFNIQGLTPRTGYYIALKSIDDAGNSSSLSNVLHAITDRNVQDWYVYQDGTGDAPTIQAAIDSARGGETVLVGPGTFFESLLIVGKGISLIGTAGASETTIDGSYKSAAVLTIRNTSPDTVTVRGVKLQHGTGSQAIQGAGTALYGGGIMAQDSNLLVSESTICDNGAIGQSTTVFGGGIYVERRASLGVVSLVCRHNNISGNIATVNGGGIGTTKVAVTIEYNDISNNSTLNGDGGGIWCLSFPGTALIASNNIVSNIAQDHGGGIYISSSDGNPLVIEDNVIYSNRAYQDELPDLRTPEVGGGLWISRASGRVVRNSIVQNSAATPDSTRGGAISLIRTSNLSLHENIIAFTANGGAVFCFEGSASVTNNIVWHNSGGTLLGSCVGLDSSNTISDPRFCSNTDDTLALKSDSPAVSFNQVVVGADRGVGCVFSQKGESPKVGRRGREPRTSIRNTPAWRVQ